MEEKKLTISDTSRIRLNSWMQFIIVAFAAVVISVLSNFIPLRLDLTEDHRYTLSEPTHRVLAGLKNDVFIQVYLDGEMPIQFKKLRRSVRESLDEFRVVSGRKIGYEFINPSAAKDGKERARLFQSLVDKGLNPIDIRDKDEEGGSTEKVVFPE